MDIQSFRQHMHATSAFGCLLAALLGLSMGFIIFVGSMIGDCQPGPGCHDNDGSVIGYRLLTTGGIALGFGIVGWLLSAFLRGLMQLRIGNHATTILLTAMALLLSWFLFPSAMALLLSAI